MLLFLYALVRWQIEKCFCPLHVVIDIGFKNVFTHFPGVLKTDLAQKMSQVKLVFVGTFVNKKTVYALKTVHAFRY